MNEILSCDWLPERARWSYLARLGLQGSRVGAVVRALASHQCVPGSIPGPGVICGLSLLLVLYSAPRGFSPGTPVFPSHQKPTLLNSNSIWKQWMKSHLVEMPLKIPIIIIIIIIIITRHVPQEQFPQKQYNKSFFDQALSVKMAGYWPLSFFCEYMGLNCVSVH